MSAPTPAPGDESPREGYYPDPSIPGYVRYWNGASWVPGTSRPAPRQPSVPGAAGGPPQAGASAPPVEETGPIFFDEEDEPPTGSAAGAGSFGPEPASVWQADTARQNGFGGERDRRVSWGDPEPGPEPEPPGRAARPAQPVDPRSAVAPPADPRGPAAPDPTGGALPGMRDGGGRAPDPAGERPPTEGTVTIRAVGRGGEAGPPRPRDAGAAPGEGTMTIRALGPAGRSAAATPQPNPGAPQGRSAVPAPSPAPQNPHVPTPHQGQLQGPVQAPAPEPGPAPAPLPPAAPHTPLTPGPGGGSASWAQQAHQLAQPERQQQQQLHQPQQQSPPPQQQGLPQQGSRQQGSQQQQSPQSSMSPPSPQHQLPGADQQPVVPWKPPVDDPFQQLARSQTSARPAGLGKRFAARLVDSLVLGAAAGAVAVPLAARALDHIDRKITAAKQTGETVTVWLLDSTTGALLGALLGAFLLLGFLLEALPTAKWGRTLGKKLFGLDVRDIESHDTPTLGSALRRWLVYGVLGLLVIGVLNVLWCLFDRPWRQCWHDKAARTFVAGRAG